MQPKISDQEFITLLRNDAENTLHSIGSDYSEENLKGLWQWQAAERMQELVSELASDRG